MKCSGEMCSIPWGDAEYGGPVSDAIVTPTRVSIDWKDDDDLWHLEAQSVDNGTTYNGTFGSPRLLPSNRVKIKRFVAADNSMLLLAEWQDSARNNEGHAIFQLDPIS